MVTAVYQESKDQQERPEHKDRNLECGGPTNPRFSPRELCGVKTYQTREDKWKGIFGEIPFESEVFSCVPAIRVL